MADHREVERLVDELIAAVRFERFAGSWQEPAIEQAKRQLLAALRRASPPPADNAEFRRGYEAGFAAARHPFHVPSLQAAMEGRAEFPALSDQEGTGASPAPANLRTERDWFDKGFIACWPAVTVEHPETKPPFALTDERMDAEWEKSAEARAALKENPHG